MQFSEIPIEKGGNKSCVFLLQNLLSQHAYVYGESCMLNISVWQGGCGTWY